ncbi:MAG: transporter substrate-binding domain-containing protein [Halopseudomonas sp.]
MPIKTFSVFSLFFTLCLLSLLAKAKADAVVELAAPLYPPVYSAGGQGLASDILRAAFDEVGVEARIQTVPIKRGVRMLEAGQIDGFGAASLVAAEIGDRRISRLPIFKDRAAWFYYRPNHSGPIVAKGLASLKGYRIGVIVNSPFLELYRSHGLDIIEIQTPQQLIGMVEKGRIDLFEAMMLTGLDLIKQFDPKHWHQFGFIPWVPIEGQIAFLNSNPTTPSLILKLEQGLARIRSNGRLLGILERYWGRGNVPNHANPQGLSGANIDSFSLKRFFNAPTASSGEPVLPR